MARKIKLVISDFHMADGQPVGVSNPLESFFEELRFADFLHYWSVDSADTVDVELIINGDFFDFISVPVMGRFHETVPEGIARRKLRNVIRGHPIVFESLRAFMDVPGRSLTFLPGNHDLELYFEAVQKDLIRILGGHVDRIKFIVDRDEYRFDGVEVQHGHQFDIAHQHDLKDILLKSHKQGPLLRLPWGSIFSLRVMNKLRKHRPYVDKVRPFSAFLLRSILYDPRFFIMVIWLSSYHFIRTRLDLRRWRARSIKRTFAILSEGAAYPNLEQRVQAHMRREKDVHTLILGHTHIPKVREFGQDGTYLNTGTWIHVTSLDIDSIGLDRRLCFALIEYPEEGPPQVCLKEWVGYHGVMKDAST